MPDIEIHGFAVHYEEYGASDARPLVLVHGLYEDASTLASLAGRFAERFRVITPDALGHGRSAHPAAFTIEDQGRMLDGLVSALGADSAAVVGISMGSYLAAQAAILEPARVSELVLVVGKAHGMTSSVAAYAQRMGFDLSTATQEETIAFMASALWSPDTPAERRAEILAMQAEAGPVELAPEEKAAVEASLAGFDLRPGLPSVTARTLVLSGRSDGLNPPEAGRELASLIPGARFEVYEHSGHLLAYEETERFVAEVEAFVLG